MAWNGSDGKKEERVPAGGAKGFNFKALAAGLIVVALGGAVIWFFVVRGPKSVATDKAEKRPSRIAAATPSAPTNRVAQKVVEKKVEEETDPAKRIVEVISCTTNRGVDQICRVYRTADGKKHKEYSPATKPIFRHGTDTLLSVLLSGSKTGVIPPMPMRSDKSLDEEFRASLNDPIVIEADDSEERAERKRQVMQAREEVKQMMDEGLSFREVISESRRLFQENAQIRREAMQELQKLHEQGDAEGERKYQITIDAALGAMGIDPMDKPMTVDEKRAKIAEAKALKAQKQTEQKK